MPRSHLGLLLPSTVSMKQSLRLEVSGKNFPKTIAPAQQPEGERSAG